MQGPITPQPRFTLPPLVGVHVTVVSQGLERSYDRARGLDDYGYRVSSCGDPSLVRQCIEGSQPDAVVVDLGREVGFPADAVVRVRDVSNVPVVVVACTGSAQEMLRCYEAGADDYCRGRCSTEEIDLRLRAIFRRINSHSGHNPVLAPPKMYIGAIEIDPGRQMVRKAGAEIPLSPTEFRLLTTLAEHPGEVIPSKALIARVWGNQYAGETHYLRLYVRYLRQKLEDDPSRPRYIVNRWGSGYAIEDGSLVTKEKAS